MPTLRRHNTMPKMMVLLLALAACKPEKAHKPAATTAPAQDETALPAVVFAPPCAAAGLTRAGQATDAALSELSGIAASRRLPGVFWAHNDSGNKARVYALSSTGQRLASWKLKKVPSTDWEDIAVGPCADGKSACVYLADTGDNQNNRAELHILRWPEPHAMPAAGEDDTLKVKGEVEVFAFALPQGPDDVEAMAVLPDGRAILFSKRNDGTTNVYRVTLGQPVTVETLGQISLRDDQADHGEALRVTAADLHPNGTSLALRTYGRVLVADLGPALAGPVADAKVALSRVQWRVWPQPDEPHGEALAWGPDGGLWLLSDMPLPIIWHAACQPPVAASPTSR